MSEAKFKVGDRVRCVDPGGYAERGLLSLGGEYTVEAYDPVGVGYVFFDNNVYCAHSFDLVEPATSAPAVSEPVRFEPGQFVVCNSQYMKIRAVDGDKAWVEYGPDAMGGVVFVSALTPA